MTKNIAPYPVYIHACGFHSALGNTDQQIHTRLLSGESPDMVTSHQWLTDGSATVVGQVSEPLPSLPPHLKAFDSRNNRLALSALQQIEGEVKQAISAYGNDRVAVIIGTSTSGIADGEAALQAKQAHGEFPEAYHYHKQEPGDPAAFISQYFALTGPCYAISTACSSSGRVFLTAKRLLKSKLVDAVIVGGVDTLCRLTLNGFRSLDALSNSHCNPFSVNRSGINIGESAAFMLLSHAAHPDSIALLGAGDSSDAHHISAPHPEGNGAEQAMRNALADAQLTPDQIGYVNAHGTATPLNDAMEGKAIARVFNQVPVSSTKPLTGHTLGAASATEAAISWQLLKYRLPLPQQVNDGQHEPLGINLITDHVELKDGAILSNSFAFGGNNISLIFGYAHE